LRSLDSITPSAEKPREDAGRGAKLPEIRFAVATPAVKIQLQAFCRRKWLGFDFLQTFKPIGACTHK